VVTKIRNINAKIPDNQESVDDGMFIEISRRGEGVFGVYEQHEQFNFTRVPLEDIDTMLEIDGQAIALFNILTLPLRSYARNWTIVPAKGGKREARFVEKHFRSEYYEGGMATKLDSIIANLCLSFAHGYKLFEKVFRLNEQEQIVYERLAPRTYKNTWVIVDKYGYFDGFRQRVSYQNEYIDLPVPKKYSALFTINDERNPNYGKSLFLPAYYHFDKKHKMYYIAHLAHQLNAVPGRVGKAPQGTKEKRREQYLAALEKFGFNSALVLPDGFELDQFPKNIRAVSPYMEIINHHDVQMAKSVVAQFMELGLGSSSGSWALSKNQFDIFLFTFTLYLEMIAEFFNCQIIPQLIDYNFGTNKYPKLKFLDIADTSTELLKEVFYKVAIDEDPNVSPEFLYSMEKAIAKKAGLDEIAYENGELKVKFSKGAYPAEPNEPPTPTGGPEPAAINNKSRQNSSKNRPAAQNKAGAKQPPNQNPPSP